MPRPPVDAVKVRAAIEVPRGDCQFKVETNRRGKFQLADPQEKPEEKIGRLRHELSDNPDDPEPYEQLYALYDEMNRNEDAKRCAAAAVELRRKQWWASPNDSHVCQEFAYALAINRDFEEAEKRARRAVASTPNDWRAQLTLGFVLFECATHDLEKETDRFGTDIECRPSRDGNSLDVTFPRGTSVRSLDDLFKSLDDRPVSKGCLDRVSQIMNEAAKCYDRAVTLAPQEPASLNGRASFAGRRTNLNGKIALLRKDVASAGELLTGSYAAALPDTAAAAHCQLQEPSGVLAAFMFDYAAYVLNQRKEGNEPTAEASKARFEELNSTADRQLDAIVMSGKRPVAAEALVAKCYLASLRNDPVAASMSCQWAIVLNPKSELAWALFLQGMPAAHPDFVPLCEAAVRRHDCHLYRGCLAAALVAAGRHADAEREITHVLNEAPEDVLANLQLAAVRLCSDTPDSMTKANEALTKAEAMAGAQPDESVRRHAATLRAAFVALNGNATIARVMLESILEQDKDAKLAKSILDALPAAAK
jgi:tetratricopeptide (TPR) repeat protein